jgi:ubiquinol-cytochrome c reductase cytochrome c1 subunit
MRIRLPILLLVLWPAFVAATGGTNTIAKAPIDLHDKQSLQRGARLFVNYCMSCHSASHMRYSRLAKDLGLSEKEVVENLMFATDKIGDTMRVAMRPDDGEVWLGIRPPDLSTIARSRGPDWLYTFLNAFYEDPSRPTGVNNLLIKDTAMPHALWELQGTQKRKTDGSAGLAQLELSAPGKLNEADYRRAVTDLVNFLAYVGEPIKLVRQSLGYWVIGFLVILLIVVYQLKQEYWKNIH